MMANRYHTYKCITNRISIGDEITHDMTDDYIQKMKDVSIRNISYDMYQKLVNFGCIPLAIAPSYDYFYIGTRFNNNYKLLHLNLLVNVNVLDISYTNLSIIPDIIFSFSSLTVLRLSNNYLVNIPLNVRKLTNLVELKCSYNMITYIPLEISELTNLKCMNFKSNYILELPNTLYRMHNLEHYDFSDNPIFYSTRSLLSYNNATCVLPTWSLFSSRTDYYSFLEKNNKLTKDQIQYMLDTEE